MRPGRYAGVLTAFGLLRLAELAYSSWNERDLRRRPGAIAADPSGFGRMAALNVALFTAPLVEVLLRRGRPLPRLVHGSAWVAQLGAVGLRLWVIATLRRAWTVRAVVPADLAVVDRGPYRFLRHPNYAAVAVEFTALPLVGGAVWNALLLSLLNAVVLRDRIAAEERLLARLPAYAERMANKPRFVPHLRDLTGR
jgi:methyltransferase